MVTCDICCGKFCKPLGNIISMQDPVGYPWEGCMLSPFSHKPFSLCYCLGTSVKHWEDVAWFVPTCRGQVGNVQHMERWGGRSWCQSRDWSKRFPKTEWTFWSCLVSFWTSPFWVPSSSLSPFPWFHVEDHVCLLDCIVVDLQDMDIFAAERHPREYSRVSENSSGDLIFPSYFVRQTGGSLLTEPCRLKLQVERNLDKWVVYFQITIYCK